MVNLPDGSPAPRPYEQTALFDMRIWAPVMYLGEILGSWVMASFLVWTMNSDALIFGSSNDG